MVGNLNFGRGVNFLASFLRGGGQISGGLGRGPAHFGPAWAGFLTAHQGPEAHFGPNLALKIGPARTGPKI